MSDQVEGFKVPDTQAGLEEVLGDQKQIVALLKAGPEVFGEFIQAYATNVYSMQKDLATQVQDQVRSTLASFIKEQAEQDGSAPVALGARPSTSAINAYAAQVNPFASGNNPRRSLYNRSAMGAPLDALFGEETGRPTGAAVEIFQLIAGHRAGTLNAAQQGKLAKIRNALSSNVPADGGFLIPENLRSLMLEAALDSAVVRPRARTIPMETLRVPIPAIDETSHVSSVFGGMVAYWTEEGGTLTETSPKFRRLQLTAKKLTGYTEIPNELLADSVGSFMSLITELFPMTLAWYEDIAFLNGTGTGEPLGMLNASNNASIVTVAKESGQPAATIVWENIVKMYARLLPSSMGRAVWVCSPDTFPELATMALSVGTGGAPVWMANGTQSPPISLLGRPIVINEKAPAVLGTVGDVSLVDFGMYLIGDRQTMTASSSEHHKFQNDETAFKIIQRLDGRPWLQSAITPQNNSATLSPVVQLATRA